MIAAQNQVDPSKTLKIRQSFTNQQRRIFATAVSRTEETLANLPDNPAQNQIDTYLNALLALLMLNVTSGTATVPYVQSAYLRGVTNANLDLRAGGLQVDGAQFAVLTQAVHKFSLQAKQDQTQAILRSIYVDTVNGVGGEFGNDSERSLNDRIKGQLRKGLNLATVVGGTYLVGIVADAFLNRVTDFGIALVSAIAEAKFTTQGDDRVCPECLHLEQQDLGNGPGIYTIGQARGLIPVHYGCLSPDTLITAVDGIASISKRVYEGDLIVINTASGKQIAITPNHPILTRVGWIAAKHINVGDEIFSDELSAPREYDAKNRPSTIKEMFDASLVSPSFVPIEMPVSPEDFHNDMGIRQPEVAIISANRHLFDNPVMMRQEGIVDHRLKFSSQFTSRLSGLSGQQQLISGFDSARGSFMRIPDLPLSLGGSHLRPLNGFGHRLCTSCNPVINEPLSDYRPGDTVSFRERVFGDSRPVFADDFFNWQADTVKSTGCVSHSGHVYNLHTKRGYYSGNNIITHNCRCTWSAIVLGKNVPFLRFR